MLEDKQLKLVNDLLNYELEYEHYELKDMYNSESEAFDYILETVQSEKGINIVSNYLRDDVENFRFLYNENPEDERNKEMYERSLKLFKEVIDYKRDFKKMEIGKII